MESSPVVSSSPPVSSSPVALQQPNTTSIRTSSSNNLPATTASDIRKSGSISIILPPPSNVRSKSSVNLSSSIPTTTTTTDIRKSSGSIILPKVDNNYNTPTTTPPTPPQEQVKHVTLHESVDHSDAHHDLEHGGDHHDEHHEYHRRNLHDYLISWLPIGKRSEKVHVPHVWPNIPHTEGVIMWDKFKYHYLTPMLGRQHTPSSTPPPTPPLYIRIIALALMCVMVLGGGMCYASVGAVTSLIVDGYGLSLSQLGQLYSIYSLPTMFSVFFAGYLSDKIGINICALMYAGLVLIGSLTVAGGNSFVAMLMGRFLYGLGNESLGVVQSALVSRWFVHDTKMSLSFSMAVTLSFYRISSFLSMSVLPILASRGLSFCLWALVIASAASFLFTIILVAIDKSYQDYLQVPQTGEPISIKDVTKFPLEFWVLALLTLFFYASILTVFTISDTYIMGKWGYSLATAGLISSTIYLTPAVCVPFIGYLIDHVGQRCKMMVVSSVLIIPAYLILSYSTINPLLGCILLGLAYSILPTCLWPGTALIVSPNILGTAYGVLASLLNCGSFICPLILTKILDVTNSYHMSMLFLMMLGATSLILSIIVFVLDKTRGNGILEITSIVKQRDKKD